jgi:GNAT superfamily N-acetyltransferase
MPTSRLSIRKAVLADVDTVHSFLTELFSIEQDHTEMPHEPIRAGLHQMLSETKYGTILLLLEAGEPVGMVNLQPMFSTAMGAPAILLEDYILIERVRGQGYGGWFMSEIKAYAKAQGVQRISLLTDEHNLGAQRFYQKHGYQFTHSIFMKTTLE